MYVFQILDELRLHRAPVRLAKAFTILQSEQTSSLHTILSLLNTSSPRCPKVVSMRDFVH